MVARTPPSRALYHGFESPLFVASLRAIGSDERTQLVILVRHPEQREALEAMRLPRCVIPKAAVDSRSLMYAADLVLGAGGTMTREAALLGVPTFSLFAGTTPAVDRWLERGGQAASTQGRGRAAAPPAARGGAGRPRAARPAQPRAGRPTSCARQRWPLQLR